MNPFMRIVFALVLAALPLVGISKPSEAGGPTAMPTVEWYNPPSVTYGGWPVTISAYLHNPTDKPVPFVASAWFNSQALNTGRYIFPLRVSWESLEDQISRDYECDTQGCRYTLKATIRPQSRAYTIFGGWSSNTLGTGITVGSITIKAEGYGSLYAEGRADLVPGPEFSVKLSRDASFAPEGGWIPLTIRATNRSLDNFQVLGVGADCREASVPDMSRWPAMWETTRAEWSVNVYIPDSVKACTITVLVKTRETVASASYVVKR